MRCKLETRGKASVESASKLINRTTRMAGGVNTDDELQR